MILLDGSNSTILPHSLLVYCVGSDSRPTNVASNEKKISFVDVSLRNRTTCPMGCLEDLTNFIEIWPFCDSKGSQKVSFRFTIGESP